MLLRCNNIYGLHGNVTVQSIGCYVCKSVNGSDTQCEDQFNAYPEAYQDSCFAARKDRAGQFPASRCIKFIAHLGK